MANENEVGALWERQGKNGTFLSGTINLEALMNLAKNSGQDVTRVQIVLFKNKFETTKSGKPAPAYRVLHDTWKPGSAGQYNQQKAAPEASKPCPF